MGIMIDTNILISALLFPSEKMNELFKIITFKFALYRKQPYCSSYQLVEDF